jgi:beta-RFAP synthase
METVHVVTGSRIHFGLLSFNNPGIPNYGGVGLMIDRPRIRIAARRAWEFQAIGYHSARVIEFVRRWTEYHGGSQSPKCLIDVMEAPPEHVGLGVGTQLGLSVATALDRLIRSVESQASVLAASVGRGLRSAIGTHGYLRGGLIVELGKSRDISLAELAERVELPSDWRVVLVRPSHTQGLSGADEQSAFERLPAVSESVRQRLVTQVMEHLLPAAREGDFDRFSESVFRYGEIVGNCFAPCQGGPFASPVLAEIIQKLRGAGVRGVGQSSWGPTLFVLQPNETRSRELVGWLRAKLHLSEDAWEVTISTPSRTGAQVEIG